MTLKMMEIVNRLESLQYDILFWKRREEDQEKIEKLSKYDEYIENLIDYIQE